VLVAGIGEPGRLDLLVEVVDNCADARGAARGILRERELPAFRYAGEVLLKIEMRRQ
jgi:hypothetical protein